MRPIQIKTKILISVVLLSICAGGCGRKPADVSTTAGACDSANGTTSTITSASCTSESITALTSAQTSVKKETNKSAGGNSAKTTDKSYRGSATAVTPSRDARYPLKVSDIRKVNYSFGFQEMVQPFWLGNVMYNECLTMIERDNGEITGKLLFTPTRIVSVYDNSLKKTYKEGVDYQWVKGTNILKWLNKSAIAYFTRNDLNGKDEEGNPLRGFDGSWDSKGRASLGGQLYCVGNYLYDKQIAVTYTYDETKWKGPRLEYQETKLPKIISKLKAGKRPHIIIYGDSIFTGCESSALWSREPNTPVFPDLIKYAIKAKYGVIAQISNPSKGGMSSSWGRENAEALVAEKSPDLVLIGFGMNDTATTPTLDNINSIIQCVKNRNPNCEFIVYSSIVPNERAGFLKKQNTYGSQFKTIEESGVAVADMFAQHEEILKVKDYFSTTGNNINHPNDWLARMYAMDAAAMLIDYSR